MNDVYDLCYKARHLMCVVGLKQVRTKQKKKASKGRKGKGSGRKSGSGKAKGKAGP